MDKVRLLWFWWRTIVARLFCFFIAFLAREQCSTVAFGKKDPYTACIDSVACCPLLCTQKDLVAWTLATMGSCKKKRPTSLLYLPSTSRGIGPDFFSASDVAPLPPPSQDVFVNNRHAASQLFLFFFVSATCLAVQVPRVCPNI